MIHQEPVINALSDRDSILPHVITSMGSPMPIKLKVADEVDRFIFGFEESYGYLAGPYVRDKDAVIGSMLICEMAAYYRSIGSSLIPLFL